MDHRLNAILKYLETQSKNLNTYLSKKENQNLNKENDYIKYLETLNNFHPYKLDPIQYEIEPINNNYNKPYGSREPYQSPKAHIISQNSNNRSSSTKHRDDYKIENNGAKSIPITSHDKVYHDIREAYNLNQVEEELKEDKFEITEKDLKEVLKEFQEGYWERYRKLELYRIPLEIGLKWFLNEILIKYYNNKYNKRKEINYYLLTSKGFEYIATFNRNEINNSYPIGEIFNQKYLLTTLKENELKELIG